MTREGDYPRSITAMKSRAKEPPMNEYALGSPEVSCGVSKTRNQRAQHGARRRFEYFLSGTPPRPQPTSLSARLTISRPRGTVSEWDRVSDALRWR
jgi:hypothetical protein